MKKRQVVSDNPFGRPLFDKPSARALRRVGVVDVGSNSVRMVVFDGAARSPAYFFNEKIMCALGAGMSETGHLNPEGRTRALNALKRFRLLAESMDAAPLTIVATAALREASDGPAFCEQVMAETGQKVWVIDGQEEARLSAQGVLLGWPGSYGLVCDIGGSSMELAEIHGGKVGRRVTSQLGPLKLRDIKGGKRERDKYIKSVVNGLHDHMGDQNDRLFLVGGSWRAIARIDMERRGYPLRVLHEYRMTAKSIRETAKFIAAHDPEKLRQTCGVSLSRMALVPIAIEVLKQVVRTFRPHDVAISSYGIREGMLYEQMPQRLKDRDPLIEACRYAEHKDARVPGFGKTVYNFIQPVVNKWPIERRRLVKAACLLHDVSWRAHPDYRAEVCFDNATRANLGGLKHSERVFLALALMYRYSSNHDDSRFAPLLDLIPERAQQEAEILGKAMRFAAMLWLEKDADPGELRWFPKKKLLELHLAPEAHDLFGEVAQSRFESLAKTLEAQTRVVS